AFSPPAKNALRLHRTYVLGQGIPMPTAQDSDVQEVIEDFWTDDANAELCQHGGQAETDAAWLTTGELFLALFVDDEDGHGKARPLAPGGAVMASFPLNRQGVRGIPELTAAVPWIQSHKRLLEAQSIMAEAKKKIALVKTVKGGPQAVGSAAALEQSSLAAD